MNKKITRNYIFNLIYQIFLIIIPIITTPYISRVLFSDGVGKYSFSASIVNYFTLFAAFGFSYYAQREIAKHNGDKYEQSKVFWEVLILKTFTTLISLCVYLILIFSNALQNYNLLLLILTINIISVALDSSYMLQGNEDFQKIIPVNLIIRILGIISIFLFVKSPEHVWLYTAINAISGILSNIILWCYLPKYLVKVDVKSLNIKKHFIPALRLFVPTIAVSVYTLLDRTLIGLMLPAETADSMVGFYDSAEKIAKMALTVVTSLSAVMIPNNAKYFAQKDYKKVNKNIETAVKFSVFLGFPIMFGLMGIASNFVPWFFGPGYEYCINLLSVLSVLVLSIGLNNVFGIQYLIPTDKENIFTLSVFIGAVINFTLNILTIPRYGAMGAAVSTVIAETVILIFQMIYLRKTFSISKTLKSMLKFCISSIVMFVVVKFTANYLESSMLNTILLVCIGIIAYFAMLLILREKFLTDIIWKVLVRMPFYQQLCIIKRYTEAGILKGNLYVNYLRYTFKFKKLDISNYSNSSFIEYKECKNEYFYYYIDKKIFVKLNKDEIILDNISVDYSLVLDKSLNDLKKEYDKNKFIDLMIMQREKILLVVDGDIKKSFENMLNKPATTFKDALQRILFVNQLLWQTGHKLNGFGRLDVVLKKYYEGDLKNKKLTPDEAKIYLQEFFKLLHFDYKYKSGSVFGDTGQVIVLGGLNEDGLYFDSKITRLILESLIELNIPDPKILLRVSQKMPKDLLELAIVSISKGTGSPLLSNDDVVIKNMIDFGYDKKDAYNYCVAACWEVYPFGNASENSHYASLNCVESFNRACMAENNNSFDELISNYKIEIIQQLEHFIHMRENLHFVEDPAMALFFNEDKNQNIISAKYCNIGILSAGLSNVVNALLNVKKYVFDDKIYTLNEMIANLENKEFRDILKSENFKFGEDNDDVISLTKALMKICSDYVKNYNKSHSIKVKLSYSSPVYLDYGKMTSASLDGRADCEPFNVHISCSRPLAYTELINFASKLDYSQPVLNGNVIDFSTTPDLIKNNIKKFSQLIYSGIKLGFYQMQINVVSSKQLIEAKRNPEKFPNLIVRVWGFSAYFNDLSDEYKDILIERTIMYENANK